MKTGIPRDTTWTSTHPSHPSSTPPSPPTPGREVLLRAASSRFDRLVGVGGGGGREGVSTRSLLRTSPMWVWFESISWEDLMRVCTRCSVGGQFLGGVVWLLGMGYTEAQVSCKANRHSMEFSRSSLCGLDRGMRREGTTERGGRGGEGDKGYNYFLYPIPWLPAKKAIPILPAVLPATSSHSPSPLCFDTTLQPPLLSSHPPRFQTRTLIRLLAT